MIVPAARSRVTRWSSTVGTCSAKAAEPRVARTPATKLRSFTGTGTPCSGDSARPSARAAADSCSAAAACLLAASGVTVM